MNKHWDDSIFDDFSKMNKITNNSRNKRCYRSNKGRVRKKSASFNDGLELGPESEISSKTWSERYEPFLIEDLIINKKKIDLFKKCLVDKPSLDDDQTVSKIIIMEGPSGCGKHSLLRCVCNSENIQVVKWEIKNNFDTYSEHICTQFRHFLMSGCYGSIFDEKNLSKILLIEDVPLYFISNPNEFEKIIIDFYPRLNSKVVFIKTSETQSNNSACKFYNFLATLTTKELNIKQFCLNKISKSAFFKLYKSIAEKEIFFRKIQIKVDQIQHLITISDGDARFFLNSLQFLVNKGLNNGKKFIDYVQSNSMLSDHSKDLFIDIFHSLGKIFYPKRLPDLDDSSLLHENQKIYSRNQLILNIDVLVISLSHSSTNFFYCIFENIFSFFEPLEVLQSILCCFSDIDLLFGFWIDNINTINHLKEEGLATICRKIIFENTSHSESEKSHTFRPLTGSKIYKTESEAEKRLDILNKGRFYHLNLSFNIMVLDYDSYSHFHQIQSPQYSSQVPSGSYFSFSSQDRINQNNAFNLQTTAQNEISTDDEILEFED